MSIFYKGGKNDLSDYELKITKLFFEKKWFREVEGLIDPNSCYFHPYMKRVVGTMKDMYYKYKCAPTLDSVKVELFHTINDYEEQEFKELFDMLAELEIEDEEKELLKSQFVYWEPEKIEMQLTNLGRNYCERKNTKPEELLLLFEKQKKMCEEGIRHLKRFENNNAVPESIRQVYEDDFD